LPYINVKVLQPLTKDQKADVIAGMTDVLVRTLGKDPNAIHVVVDEVSADNWGLGGRLVSERMKGKA
jgi:4-oxalocrotonate tautomerase